MTVFRDGEIKNMHQDDLLVGDVVEITEGMEIPADAIILEANEVTTDESAMTGESDPIVKNTLGQCITKRNDFEQNYSKNNC